MPGTLIDTVSDTAFGVAYYRAEEGERQDPLFRDPLAHRLAGEKGKDVAEAMPMPFMARQMVVIRTYIIDAYIQTAISNGVDSILNLGAGLDTRPYRMQLPKTLVWTEVDYPHVIEFKEERLSHEEPQCQLQRVRLDLGNIEERRRLFISVNAHASRLLILTEGVVAYLSVDEVSSLVNRLLPAGSRSLLGGRVLITRACSVSAKTKNSTGDAKCTLQVQCAGLVRFL